MLLLYIIVAILMFGSLIFIHELGHFLTARLFHVTIYEFAIGMGPKLISWKSKKNGTGSKTRRRAERPKDISLSQTPFRATCG